jgi:hypothetical protein
VVVYRHLGPYYMGKRKAKNAAAPKKAHKVLNIPPLPWTAERSKLIWTLLTEIEKGENFKVLFGKRTKGKVSNWKICPP